MGCCADCRHWITLRTTIYGNGDEVDTWRATNGGECNELEIKTSADFGCNRFEAMGEIASHTAITEKDGAPWQHFKMIPCPDCAGDGTGGSRGHRCAGTGLVRLYDDGYIGDEQTRMHPKEIAARAPPGCPKCNKQIEASWNVCPYCGEQIRVIASPQTDEHSGNAWMAGEIGR